MSLAAPPRLGDDAASMSKAHLLSTPLLLALLVGCDNKVTECNKLADIANASVTKIGEIEARSSQEPAAVAKDIKEMADVATSTKKQIEEIDITTEELKPKAEKYQAMLDEMAKVSNEYAELMNKAADLQGEKLAAAEKEFTATQEALTEACGEGSEGAADSCAKLDELLKKQPDNMPEDEMAKILEQFAKDLQALELDDEKVKKAVGAHATAVQEYRKLLVEMQGFETKVAEAEKKFDAVVQQEDAVVSELNTFCTGSPG